MAKDAYDLDSAIEARRVLCQTAEREDDALGNWLDCRKCAVKSGLFKSGIKEKVELRTTDLYGAIGD